MLLPLSALACVGLVLAIGAFWVGPKLPRRGRVALAVGAALAVPIAWLAGLSLADQALVATAPVSALTFASYVGLGVALLAVAQGVALFLPERMLWRAAAVVPFAAVVLASLKPSTTIGGVVTVLLSFVLMAGAVTLPRAGALALVDRSRSFVGIVAALTLVLGAVFGGFLAAAAVQEGGLGLASGARDFRLEVSPSWVGESYRLVVPFPVAGGEAGEVAAQWQGHARVTEGSGAVSFLENLSALEILARGRVVVEARYLFHAPEQMRANLTAYELADVPVVVEGPEGAYASLRWSATARAGDAACAERVVQMRADVGTPARLAPPDERALWPGATC